MRSERPAVTILNFRINTFYNTLTPELIAELSNKWNFTVKNNLYDY